MICDKCSREIDILEGIVVKHYLFCGVVCFTKFFNFGKLKKEFSE